MRIEDVTAYQDNIRNEADRLRRATRLIQPLKPVIQSFNGKVYNKRFREALTALKMDDDGLRYWIDERYEYFNIEITRIMHYNEKITILNGYNCHAHNRPDAERIIFDDNKRIKANAMIDLLNSSYAGILQKAAELDRAADNLPEILKQIKSTTELLTHLVNDLPDGVRSACKIDHFYYYL